MLLEKHTWQYTLAAQDVAATLKQEASQNINTFGTLRRQVAKSWVNMGLACIINVKHTQHD